MLDQTTNIVDRIAVASGAQRDRDAIEIGQLFHKSKKFLAENVRYQIECGYRLSKKRKERGHGRWLSWVSANADLLGFSNDSTARRLIAAWKSWRKHYASDEEAFRALTHDIGNLSPEHLAQMSRATWGNEDSIRSNAEITRENLSGSDDHEFYTPANIIKLVKDLFDGEIDFDPATCQEAQRIVRARHIRTVGNDGLKCEWFGKLFLNPPYGRAIDAWIEKLVGEFEAGHVTEAVALLPSRTGAAWFQFLDRFPRCFVRGRLKSHGPNASTPTFDSVIVYLGPHLERFAETFGGIGSIFVRYGAAGR